MQQRVYMLLLSAIALSVLLASSASAELFGPLQIIEDLHFERLPAFYESQYIFIDFILALIFFMSLATGAGEKGPAKHLGKTPLRIIGVILAIGFMMFEYTAGFRLSNLGPLAAVLLIFAISYAIYSAIKGHGHKDRAIAASYLIFYVLYWFITALLIPDYKNWMYTNKLYYADGIMGLLALIAGIYLIIGIVGKGFKGRGSGSLGSADPLGNSAPANLNTTQNIADIPVTGGAWSSFQNWRDDRKVAQSHQELDRALQNVMISESAFQQHAAEEMTALIGAITTLLNDLKDAMKVEQSIQGLLRTRPDNPQFQAARAQAQQQLASYHRYIERLQQHLTTIQGLTADLERKLETEVRLETNAENILTGLAEAARIDTTTFARADRKFVEGLVTKNQQLQVAVRDLVAIEREAKVTLTALIQNLTNLSRELAGLQQSYAPTSMTEDALMRLREQSARSIVLVAKTTRDNATKLLQLLSYANNIERNILSLEADVTRMRGLAGGAAGVP